MKKLDIFKIVSEVTGVVFFVVGVQMLLSWMASAKSDLALLAMIPTIMIASVFGGMYLQSVFTRVSSFINRKENSQ